MLYHTYSTACSTWWYQQSTTNIDPSTIVDWIMYKNSNFSFLGESVFGRYRMKTNKPYERARILTTQLLRTYFNYLSRLINEIEINADALCALAERCCLPLSLPFSRISFRNEIDIFRSIRSMPSEDRLCEFPNYFRYINTF